MDNILRRKIGQEADLKVVEHITKDNSGNHLSRIYKLSSMDDLMKGFGINENKPRSQRGGGNAIMPSLPPPPRSSRHDKYKEFESIDKLGNKNSYNNLFRGKLPSIYKTEGLASGGRGSDSKQGLVSHLNLRKDSGDESKHLGIKNDQSQPINLKRKPTEIKQDIDVSGSLVFNFGVKTRAGRVGANRKINQDNYIINQMYMGSQENAFLCVLDGHGNDGHKVSHFLKMNLANSVAKELKKANVSDETLFGDQSHAGVIRAFLSTDAEMNRMNPAMTDVSGSTCIAVVVMKNRLISANLGDSCAGLLSMDQDNWDLKMLNREHKPTEKDERERVENSGGRVEPFRDQFGQFIGPLRVWKKYEQLPGLMMSRSFGDARAHTCGVISTPEVLNFKLDKTSRAIILGSDGMWEVLTMDKIKNIVAKYYKSKRSDEAASELLEASQAAWSKKVEFIAHQESYVL